MMYTMHLRYIKKHFAQVENMHKNEGMPLDPLRKACFCMQLAQQST